MKTCLFTFIIGLFYHLVCAQTVENITLDWKDKQSIPIGNRFFISPSFNGPSFHLNVDAKTVSFNLVISNVANNTSIQLTSVQYEDITLADIGDLDASQLPSSIEEKFNLTKARNEVIGVFEFSPIIKDLNGIKRVKSVSYYLSSNSSKNNFVGSLQKTEAITSSVLASGNWFQFKIEQSGVYKINRTFLQQLGINTNSLNPRNIKIYGNGGRMLPLSNMPLTPIDLEETPIIVQGENDGVFNSDDFILMYAQGANTWNDESQTFVNLYDDNVYYYITTDGGAGKRIPLMNQPSGQPTLNVSSFDDTQFYEVDKFNIGQTGRQWFGEKFDISKEQEFSIDFPNIDNSSPATINIVAASVAFTPSSFAVSANNAPIGVINFPALTVNSGLSYYSGALPNNTTFNGLDKNIIRLTYNNGGLPNAVGYLDYIKINAKRRLIGYGKQFHFQLNNAATSIGIVQYNLTNANSISEVWDVTHLNQIQRVQNSNQANFSFKANLGEERKYVAIDASDFKSPQLLRSSRVSNQNIKGTIFRSNSGVFEDVDYLIITPRQFQNQAEKLANFHQNNSKLNVRVLLTEQIYHEFSSGRQDIAAIRNCIKYVYQNASSPEKRLRYVNLFGDASFDYKDRIPNNTNFVPIFQSLRSNTTGELSFCSDDFYGLMDDNEGNIVNRFGGIDIAVGRMIVNDVQQADAMVQKVIDYNDENSFGNWRNNFVLIGDDSDVSSDSSLQEKQNNLGDLVTTEKPFLNVSKILLDAYVQEASAGGFRYPKARTDIFNSFEKGALVFNYLGHGGEDGLSAERIWETSDGQNLNNKYKYPLFVTITCEFSRFDNPTRFTAGEYTYWNPNGGAIAMITTIRSIGQFSAESFNPVLTRNLLSFGSNNYVSMAEALRISKNANPNSSTNVVVFIGDPAIDLAIAKPKVNLTKVNDVSISQPIDDLKSLSKIKISGEITDENNLLLSNYNGEVTTVITDKTLVRNTLNNDGNSPPISFNVLGEAIFRGNASVKNGQFEFSFIVPRDIRIPVGSGKISFYSKRNAVKEDQTGFSNAIRVGGINENAAQDNINPKVKLYMNDENFISGGITNQSPLLIAKLEDESGINTAGGIGHDIVAILDGDESNPIILNDYYETALDDFTKGSIRFPLRNLAPGLHTIVLRAWDVYNNPVIGEIQFLVLNDEGISITNVLNYPNPFVNYTEFWFTHNRPFEPLEVQVQVMTITGKLVWTKNQIVTTEGFLSREINWDGKDSFGDRLGKGVYVYRLTVRSSLTNKKTEKIEKLVIL